MQFRRVQSRPRWRGDSTTTDPVCICQTAACRGSSVCVWRSAAASQHRTPHMQSRVGRVGGGGCNGQSHSDCLPGDRLQTNPDTATVHWKNKQTVKWRANLISVDWREEKRQRQRERERESVSERIPLLHNRPIAIALEFPPLFSITSIEWPQRAIIYLSVSLSNSLSISIALRRSPRS